MDLYDDKNISPMLLFEVKKPFDDENYLFELKFDGTRALIFVEPKKVLIKNKRNIILNNTFPELLNITKMVKNKCIFDGEIIVVYDGLPSFKKLQERALLKDTIRINYMKEKYPVTFICFDVLYDKKDLTSLSLIERKKYLNKYKDNDIFVKTKYYLNDGIKLYNTVKKMNLEGIVAKEIHSKYKVNKRSKDWLKIKNLMDGDFFIGGYKEDNEGSLASLILGSISDNEYIYIGNVTIGKNNPEFKIIKRCKPLKYSPFSGFKEKGYKFIEPKLKCTVEFIEKTDYNSLRQPIYKSLKLD